MQIPEAKAELKIEAKAKRGEAKKRIAPPINYTARGDKRRGLAVARDPDLLAGAMETYKNEVRSAGDTSDDNVKTWLDFHEVVTWSRFGLPDPCPMLPLSPVKIMTIGSIFKIAGYRSTKNYLSAVKRLHIIEGRSWSGQLMVAAQAFKASTERGIGPAKQPCPLPWAKMVAADLDEHLAEERFPLCPNYCVV